MSANETQHGGTHYKALRIQPWDYIDANDIPFLEGSAIKYLTRWRDKGGVEDLRKAIHFIQKRIEIEESTQPCKTKD
jgi:UDP-3-O-acyl-N-acetylglucosamine deacetylase